jgi:hypothetical protein
LPENIKQFHAETEGRVNALQHKRGAEVDTEASLTMAISLD